MSQDKRPPKPPGEEAREVGLALRRLRERQRVTQERAAENMGVTRTAWQNYENGRTVVMRTDVQARLAQALGAEREDLLALLRDIQRGERSQSSTGFAESARIFTGPGRQEAVFPLPEGDVVISFPSRMTPEGVQQLSEYLALFIRSRST